MLLSGVVRNRKLALTSVVRSQQDAASRQRFISTDSADHGHNNSNIDNNDLSQYSFWNYCRGGCTWDDVNHSVLGTSSPLNFRVHRFVLQWDLWVHLIMSTSSLIPYFFSHSQIARLYPIAVWCFYNALFFVPTRPAEKYIGKTGRFISKIKNSFTKSMDGLVTPRVLPVLSISFLLLALSLGTTGTTIGGAPLCFNTCRKCLSSWENAVSIRDYTSDPYAPEPDPYKVQCGYINGKELIGFYTMVQVAFLLFVTTIAALAGCLAWKVADDEVLEREESVEWLMKEDLRAYEVRDDMLRRFGAPGSNIRPDGSPTWVIFGVVSALTFTLLGWHNWYALSPSHTATILIVLNLLSIMMSSLMLHLGFFGRILALYKRNFMRVQYLTQRLDELGEYSLDAWWNCRNFVLNDDLALDYDIGGLAVSFAALVTFASFFYLIKLYMEEGFASIMHSPGSYCAYSCMYYTTCLIKIFTLATETFEEQRRHATALQELSTKLLRTVIAANSSSVTPTIESPTGIIGYAAHDQSESEIGGDPYNDNAYKGKLVPDAEDGFYLEDDDVGDLYDDSSSKSYATGKINHRIYLDASAGQIGDAASVGHPFQGTNRYSSGMVGAPNTIDIPLDHISDDFTTSAELPSRYRQDDHDPKNSALFVHTDYDQLYSGLNEDERAAENARDLDYEQEREKDRLRTPVDPDVSKYTMTSAAVNNQTNSLNFRMVTLENNIINTKVGQDRNQIGDQISGEPENRSNYDNAMLKNTKWSPQNILSISNTNRGNISNINGIIDSEQERGKTRFNALFEYAFGGWNGSSNNAYEANDFDLTGNRESTVSMMNTVGENISDIESRGGILEGGVVSPSGSFTLSKASSPRNFSPLHTHISTLSSEGKSGNTWVNPSLKVTTSYVNLQSSSTAEDATVDTHGGGGENLSQDIINQGTNSVHGNTSTIGGGMKNLHNLSVNTSRDYNHLQPIDPTVAVSSVGIDISAEVTPGTRPSSIGDATSSLRSPSLHRQLSYTANIESKRQTLAEMISQIRKYDPYPCMLGIPIMPAIFATSKIYIFFAFLLLGAHAMTFCMHLIL